LKSIEGGNDGSIEVGRRLDARGLCRFKNVLDALADGISVNGIDWLGGLVLFGVST